MGGIIEKVFGEINDWGHKVLGLSSPDHPNGTSANISINGSTSTDMGFDLEGKNTALTMGEMQPGEWTEMYGNNTAYQEEKNNSTNYVKDLIAPLLTGAATSYIDNYYNRRYQREQNEWNANQTALDREWQEHMANTAHQRELQDLLATGLNPVNTATGGGGAATPGGANATGTTPPYMNTSGTVGNTALSLAETMKALSENKYISKEKKAQIANTIADTAQKEAGTGLTKAQTEQSEAETGKIKAEKENLAEMKKQIIEQVRKDKMNNDYNDFIGMPSDSPQAIRYWKAIAAGAGLHGENGNENNEDIVTQISEFKKWCEKNGIGAVPMNMLKQLLNIYKNQ